MHKTALIITTYNRSEMNEMQIATAALILSIVSLAVNIIIHIKSIKK